ncbi:MAG: hypothetical protein WD733_23370 [Bryobacterales bacterium]
MGARMDVRMVRVGDSHRVSRPPCIERQPKFAGARNTVTVPFGTSPGARTTVTVPFVPFGIVPFGT